VKPLTIKSFLLELARDIYSASSKKASSKLSMRLTTMQCYVLHLVASGTRVPFDLKSSRQGLIKTGFIYHHPDPAGTRGLNGRILHVYRLTDKGEIAHDEILRAFGPIVERINAKREEVTA
jgi:hypothetical protein